MMTRRKRLPSLKDLEAARNQHRRRTGTLNDLLKAEGIKTNKDLYAFLKRNVIKGKRESNYDILVRKFGENNAVKIMRLVEVAEWKME